MIKRTYLAAALVLFCSELVFAQLPRFLSDSASIKVMTLGPSQEELYTAFGHSAFRVTDYKLGTDLVFNYGVFSFNQPNFYLNFARGRLLYKLGVQYYESFKDSYIEENRYIIEQELNLTEEEQKELYAFLYTNSLPANRDYYYNYIYDNCATRIRDVVEKVFPGRIDFQYPYVNEDLTFRDLMDLYLGEQPWGDVGIDICLGLGIDKVANGYQYMFLPDYIEEGMEHATLLRDGQKHPLVLKKEIVYMPEQSQVSSANWLTPTLLFALIFFAVGFSTHQEFKTGRRRKTVDFVTFLLTGVVGILLLFLWFGTDHISQYNFNLLWAIPVHAFIAFLSFRELPPAWLRHYLLANAAVIVLLIALWAWLPQQLNLALVPLLLILLLRSLFWRSMIQVRAKS